MYLEHFFIGTEKQNLNKTQSKPKINVTLQPIPSNLGFGQPHHSTGEMEILQTATVTGSANGGGKKTYFIPRRERQTYSPPSSACPLPWQRPRSAVSVNSNSIPGLRKPLEGIQSRTYVSWLSPFSWCKLGCVLTTWLVSWISACPFSFIYFLLLLSPQLSEIQREG